MDLDGEVVYGQIVGVIIGTTNANTLFQLTTVGPYVLDTTALVFTKAGGGGNITIVQTTDATKTNLATGALASGEVATIDARGQAFESATGDIYWFQIVGCVKNIGGTTTLVGTPVIVDDNDAGGSTWIVGLEADDTLDNWELTVTGEAAHTIEWKLSYVEVKQ